MSRVQKSENGALVGCLKGLVWVEEAGKGFKRAKCGLTLGILLRHGTRTASVLVDFLSGVPFVSPS